MLLTTLTLYAALLGGFATLRLITRSHQAAVEILTAYEATLSSARALQGAAADSPVAAAVPGLKPRLPSIDEATTMSRAA